MKWQRRVLQMGARWGMQTEEALEAVLAWLTSTVQRLTDDPLLQLAGSFASPVTDVSDQHDAYIGQSIQGKTYVDYYR